MGRSAMISAEEMRPSLECSGPEVGAGNDRGGYRAADVANWRIGVGGPCQSSPIRLRFIWTAVFQPGKGGLLRYLLCFRCSHYGLLLEGEGGSGSFGSSFASLHLFSR